MAIKKKNLILYIVLTVVTCGAFGLYWAYTLAKDVQSMKETEENGILELVLLILIPFVGMYLVEKKYVETCAEKGIECKDNTILYTILTFLYPVIGFALLQNDLNKIATEE